MIYETFVKEVREIERIINDIIKKFSLDKTYKTFELLTILNISSGYLIFYKLGKEKKK